MGYKDEFAKAKKEGKTTTMTPKYVKFEKKGDLVIGQIVAYHKIKSSKNEGEYCQYLMKTDDGLIKFAPGSAADREIIPVLDKTAIYEIVYQGKEEIGGGQRVNKFNIEKFEAGLDAVEFPDGNVPF